MTNREWLSRLSNEELENWLCDTVYNKELSRKLETDISKSQTPLDVVNVVRCEDCIWENNCNIRDYFWTGNDFCSKGTRRESE